MFRLVIISFKKIELALVKPQVLQLLDKASFKIWFVGGLQAVLHATAVSWISIMATAETRKRQLANEVLQAPRVQGPLKQIKSTSNDLSTIRL